MSSRNVFEPVSIWDAKTILGEGVVWVESEESVYFVDIEGKKIFRYCLADQQTKVWNVPKKPVFIFPTNRSVMLCGMEDGLYWFNLSDGTVRQWFPIPEKPSENKQLNNRINDGYVDAQGRLWFGTMHVEEKENTGSLYLLEWKKGEPALIRQDSGYSVINGPVISNDGKTLYCSHTPAQEIYSFEIEGNKLTNKKVFVKEKDGYPDGMAVDMDGNLWVCLYKGHKVNVYSREGQKLRSISFTCPNLTKIAFGGKERKHAFVTSASLGAPKDKVDHWHEIGGLFTFTVETAGQKQNIFNISDSVKSEEQIFQ